MNREDEYQQHAVECLQMARTGSTPEIRVLFLEMARRWGLLVDYAQKHGGRSVPPPMGFSSTRFW